MADTFNMSDVFISYSRKDSAFARKLYDSFKALDMEVWVDFEDIPLTADWWQEIQAGIDASEAFIFIISPDSARSEICTKEVAHAVSTNKRLIPILHREVTDPEDQQKMHESISAHNWLFFRDEDDYETAYKSLLASVQTDLDYNRDHTRLLVRAKEWQDNQQDRSYLVRGEDLHQAEEFLTASLSKTPSATPLHAQYIRASRKALSGQQRRLLLYGTIVLGVAIALTVFALLQWRDAQVARQLADTARDAADVAREKAEDSASKAHSLALAANSQDLLSNDNPDLAITLAIHAIEEDESQPQVIRAFRDAVYTAGTQLRIADHSEFIWSLDYHPTQDIILSGAADHTACLWNATAGNLMICLGDGVAAHRDEVTVVRFHPNGKTAFTGSLDGTVKIWDTDEDSASFGTELDRFTYDGSIRSLAVHPRGESILIGTDQGLMIHWDLRRGRFRQLQRAHVREVMAIDFSADGNRALSGGMDGYVIIWDLRQGTWDRLFQGHDEGVLSVQFSRNDRLALSGGEDNLVIMWDIISRRPLFSFEGHDSGVSSVMFGPDPDQFLTASWDNSIRIWNLDNHRLIGSYNGHTGGVNAVALSADREHFVSGSYDTDMRIWSVDSYVQLEEIDEDRSDVRDVMVSHDGSYIASAHDSTYVQLWGGDTGDTGDLRRTLRGHTDWVVSLDISPDDRHIASVSLSNHLIVWDVETGSQVLHIRNSGARTLSALFSPDGRYVMVGLQKSLRYWDLETGLLAGEVMYQGSAAGNNALAISPDSKYILVGMSGVKDNLHLYDLDSGELLHSLRGHTDGVLSVDFSSDGKLALSGSWDNGIRIWNVETGTLDHILLGHSDRVTAVAFSPDDSMIVSGSNDLSVRLWDVASHTETYRFDGHTDRVTAVDFDPDGTHIVSSSKDASVIIWQLPQSLDKLVEWAKSNRYIRDLNCTERKVYQVEPLCEGA